MDLSKLVDGLRREHAENLRAAWLSGGFGGSIAAPPGEAFLFCVYTSCEGWRYGFWRAGKIILPLCGSTFEGALGAFLATPPTNYNMALLACRFGRKLLDQDGSGETLSAKAADLWSIGPPPLDPGRIPRLLWEMKRTCTDIERWSECAPCDSYERARYETLMTTALERVLAAFCRAQGLWWLPMAELYRAVEDGRYSRLASRVEEFLATDDLGRKAQAALAAAAFVIAAMPAVPDQRADGAPPAPPGGSGLGAWPARGRNKK